MTKHTIVSPHEFYKNFSIAHGAKTRDVAFTAYVYFTTKREVQTYCQSQRIAGFKCRVVKELIDGEMFYVPYIHE